MLSARTKPILWVPDGLPAPIEGEYMKFYYFETRCPVGICSQIKEYKTREVNKSSSLVEKLTPVAEEEEEVVVAKMVKKAFSHVVAAKDESSRCKTKRSSIHASIMKKIWFGCNKQIPDVEIRRQISLQLGLSMNQVSYWFKTNQEK